MLASYRCKPSIGGRLPPAWGLNGTVRLAVLIGVLVPSAYAQPANDSNFFSDQFFHGLFTAVLSAVLGFSFAYLLARLNKWTRDSRLAHSESSQTTVLDIEEELRQRVKLRYDNKEIGQLTSTVITLENIGTKLIRAEEIRFELPNTARILDFRLLQAAPELKTEILKNGVGGNEAQVRIGRIDRRQKLKLRIVFTSDDVVPVSVHGGTDDTEGVELVDRSKTKTFTEQEQITKFLSAALLYCLVESLSGHLLFSPLTAGIVNCARLLIIGYLLRYSYPICKVVANVIVSVSGTQSLALRKARQSRSENRESLRSEKYATLRKPTGQKDSHNALTESIKTAIQAYIEAKDLDRTNIRACLIEVCDFTWQEVDGASQFQHREEFDRLFHRVFESSFPDHNFS